MRALDSLAADARTTRFAALLSAMGLLVVVSACGVSPPGRATGASTPAKSESRVSASTGAGSGQGMAFDSGMPCCGVVTPAAQHVLDVLDASDVEHRWLNHRHVDWETGVPDKPVDYAGHGTHTHCSAFAAAIGERLGVYMLRPPDHSQILLASAQTRWFDQAAGVRSGWQPVAGAAQAQRLANQGKLVVISYENPNPHKPGHIVIVRPSLITADALRAHGPKVTQAGTRNDLQYDADSAFSVHPGAWPDRVKYFAHDVPAVN